MRVMIWSAHAAAANEADGRHENTIFRLGDSDRPTVLLGPMTVSSMMCGGTVVPALFVPAAASDQSWGLIKSSYGPSVRRTKAADTRCCPAFTRIGSLRT